MRTLHALARMVPNHLWKSVSFFEDGGVQVVFTDTFPIALTEKAAKYTSGSPSGDASHLADDGGQTKKKETSPRRKWLGLW